MLIPHAFWFRTSFRCPLVRGIPLKNDQPRLLDLPQSCRLPDLPLLSQESPWAEVRVAWNPSGLGISVLTRKNPRPFPSLMFESPETEGFRVWIDTRDTHDVHRASRYCHCFWVGVNATLNGQLLVTTDQKTINRALADAPRANGRDFQAKVCAPDSKNSGGWLAELFLKSAALNGFDPESTRKLGFLIEVVDPQRGTQSLGLGREFPIADDPSLWSTLELLDH